MKKVRGKKDCVWASNLNETIGLWTWKSGHPLAGMIVGDGYFDIEADTECEVKTVLEWGKELAALEMTEMSAWDPRVTRMHNIARMFYEAKLTCKNGPAWWRLL